MGDASVLSSCLTVTASGKEMMWGSGVVDDAGKEEEEVEVDVAEI